MLPRVCNRPLYFRIERWPNNSYKKHGAPDALALLTDAALAESGVREKEDRRLVLAAVRKAGYKAASASPRKRPATSAEGADRTNESVRHSSMPRSCVGVDVVCDFVIARSVTSEEEKTE